MNDQSISEEDAIRQVRDWANSGDLAKAMQGCREILEVDPANEEVTAMLKDYEQKTGNLPKNMDPAKMSPPSPNTTPELVIQPTPIVQAETTNQPISQPEAIVQLTPIVQAKSASQDESGAQSEQTPALPTPNPSIIAPSPTAIPITQPLSIETTNIPKSIEPMGTEPAFSLEGHEPISLSFSDNVEGQIPNTQDEKDKKMGLRIVAAIISITLLGTLGYYTYTIIISKKSITSPPAAIISGETPSPTIISTPNSTPEATPTVDEPIVPKSPEASPLITFEPSPETTPTSEPKISISTSLSPEPSSETSPQNSPTVSPSPDKVKVDLGF